MGKQYRIEALPDHPETEPRVIPSLPVIVGGIGSHDLDLVLKVPLVRCQRIWAGWERGEENNMTPARDPKLSFWKVSGGLKPEA